MAGAKIFVSSTCYDLSVLRAELRNFIISLGHEPVMSEYADVLYDPRIHTHTSCVNEVTNCDMMVVNIEYQNCVTLGSNCFSHSQITFPFEQESPANAHGSALAGEMSYSRFSFLPHKNW